MVLLELTLVAGSGLQFDFDIDRFSVTAPADFDSLFPCDYQLEYDPSQGVFAITFLLPGREYDVIEYAIRNYLESVRVETLKSYCKAVGIKIPSGSPAIDIAELVIDSRPLIPADVKKSALESYAALIAKRSRKKKEKDVDDATGSFGEDDAESGDESDTGDLNDDEVLQGDIPASLKSMATREVAYMLGKIGGGAALCEEETDEAIQHHQETQGEVQPPKPRTVAKRKAPADTVAAASADDHDDSAVPAVGGASAPDPPGGLSKEDEDLEWELIGPSDDDVFDGLFEPAPLPPAGAAPSGALAEQPGKVLGPSSNNATVRFHLFCPRRLGQHHCICLV